MVRMVRCRCRGSVAVTTYRSRMETLHGWAFMLGPVAGVVVVPVLWALLNNNATHRSMRHLALAVGVLLVAHWVVWLLSFDTIQGEPIPNGLFPVSTALAYASAFGCLFALGVTVRATWSAGATARQRHARH